MPSEWFNGYIVRLPVYVAVNSGVVLWAYDTQAKSIHIRNYKLYVYTHDQGIYDRDVK